MLHVGRNREPNEPRGHGPFDAAGLPVSRRAAAADPAVRHDAEYAEENRNSNQRVTQEPHVYVSGCKKYTRTSAPHR